MVFIMHLQWLAASTEWIMLAASQHRCVISNMCFIYGKLLRDDGQLIYSKHVHDDYWNKLRDRSANCWSLLCKYITMHVPQNVKCLGGGGPTVELMSALGPTIQIWRMKLHLGWAMIYHSFTQDGTGKLRQHIPLLSNSMYRAKLLEFVILVF